MKRWKLIFVISVILDIQIFVLNFLFIYCILILEKFYIIIIISDTNSVKNLE
jgi:hypothetical protein